MCDFGGMKNKWLLPVVAGGFAVVAAVGYGVYATSRAAVAAAPSSTLRRDGDFALREYPELPVIETSMRSGDEAFMRLFRFIDGQNARREKIAMTAPVFVDGAETMSFVLPAGTAAEASGADVRVGRRPAERVAVYRFSGRVRPGQAGEAEKRLRAWMAAQHLAPRGELIEAYYDSPFVPGPLRRNEVMLRVAD